MNLSSARLNPLLLVSFLIVVTVGAQNIPVIPPSGDPAFWGHPNKPYTLKLVITSTSAAVNNLPETHTSEENVFRDSEGRTRTEDFYDNGRPSIVSVRDPRRDTCISMQLEKKTAWILFAPRPTSPPSGKGWTVEQLSSRVIAGFPAQGFRFMRDIPASADGRRAHDRVVEEDWISRELGVLLEQKIESQRNGTTIKRVSEIKQIEPDPNLFSIPSDYTIQQETGSLPR